MPTTDFILVPDTTQTAQTTVNPVEQELSAIVHYVRVTNSTPVRYQPGKFTLWLSRVHLWSRDNVVTIHQSVAFLHVVLLGVFQSAVSVYNGVNILIQSSAVPEPLAAYITGAVILLAIIVIGILTSFKTAWSSVALCLVLVTIVMLVSSVYLKFFQHVDDILEAFCFNVRHLPSLEERIAYLKTLIGARDLDMATLTAIAEQASTYKETLEQLEVEQARLKELAQWNRDKEGLAWWATISCIAVKFNVLSWIGQHVFGLDRVVDDVRNLVEGYFNDQREAREAVWRVNLGRYWYEGVVRYFPQFALRCARYYASRLAGEIALDIIVEFLERYR